MRFTLEDYQIEATRSVLSGVAKARRDYRDDGDRTAVGLTAPTGAGKTVIATAVLEGLYFGTEVSEPDPNLTCLWVTDDPALNRQTINKILQASGGRIDPYRIRFLADDDQRSLEPGYIYFVHIQALSKNSNLHAVRADGTRSDRRTFGAWEMIANTVKDRGGDFIVIWDEAHRGSGTTKTDRKTIAGTIVNGGTTNIGTQQPAAPVVLGISATPEKFTASMSASGRTMRTVEVPASAVRQSGLLKDRILLRSIAEDQTADNTMLTLAVRDLKASTDAWTKHHEATGDRLVEPLLVVQVPPKVPDSRLIDMLAVIESAWPELSDYAIAHAFGDPHGPLRLGGKSVRYLPPEAIEGDDRARVVLFKSALTTGWDCPRAEVLVSFQSRESFTEIAQLIGRLVRTPLAQRVDGGDARLNEVMAYLPGFKTEHVVRVVNALTKDENVESEIVIVPEICEKSTTVPTGLFNLLDTIPSYMRPVATYPTRTAQLMRLAAALNEHDLVVGASKKARDWIVNQMRAADSAREEEIDKRVENDLALTVGTLTLGYGAEITTETTTDDEATVERDLDGYYSKAQRLLPDGSAAWYYNDLCDRGYDEIDAGVRVAAMASLDYKDIVEKQAEEQIKTWRDAHASAVASKPRAVRDLIEPLWYLGNTPMHPTTVEARTAYAAATHRIFGDSTEPIATYPKHLYVIPDGRPNEGRFPVDTSRSSWELEVLERETAGTVETLAGWYRNPSSGRYALAISYEIGTKTRLMHPDFLFWHDDGGGYVMDIVDPHRHDQTDTASKWSALAKYAQDHSDRVRRVLAVIKDSSGDLRALDLTKDGIGPKAAAAINGVSMEALFAAEGMAY